MGGILENCLPMPGSPCHCVFCSGHFMAVQSWPWALLWGETRSSFLFPGLVSLRACLRGSFANPGTDGWCPKAGSRFGGAALWLLPFLPPCSWRWPEQWAVPGETFRGVVPVAEPAPQPAEQRPALTPTAQPDRGVPGEESSVSPEFLSSELEPWPSRIRVQQGLEHFPAAACCHRPVLLLAALATEVVWVSATLQHLCWCKMLFSLLFAPYT